MSGSLTANKHRAIIAVVRHVEDLDRACLLSDPNQVHFVCLSLETLLRARDRGLSVSTPADYESLRDRDFSIEGQRLALEWLKSVVPQSLVQSEELQTYLATQYTFFFAMALFALELTQAVAHTHPLERVYLWRDAERPILGDWPPGVGEGAIFAQVAAAWLAERNIPSDFLDRGNDPREPTDDDEASSVSGRLRSHALRLPRPLFAGLRTMYRGGRSLLKLSKDYLMRARLAWARRRSVIGRPTVLFWGAHVDAVYQEELARQWQRERGWNTVRVEDHHPLNLIARTRTRNSSVQLGLNAELLIDAFRPSQDPAPASDSPGLSSLDYSALESNSRKPTIADRTLSYQYRAMIRAATTLSDQIRSHATLLSQLRPDCVVTHLAPLIAIAARAAGIPSVVVAHGGIFFPEFVSVHGDVNVVAGDMQKRFYENLRPASGRLAAVGWPHVPQPRDPRGKLPCEPRPVVSVVLLVTDADYYFWENTDLLVYVDTLLKLRDLANAKRFKLLVKLHPRYGQVSLYRELFHPDGERIQIETTPDLDKILGQADIAVVCGLTTAIIETIGFGIATVGFFYHSQPRLRLTPYHQALDTVAAVAADVQGLEEILLRLSASPQERAALVQRQAEILPEMLASAGEDAARHVGDICQELIDRQIYARH
jgi:hypothetical protein